MKPVSSFTNILIVDDNKENLWLISEHVSEIENINIIAVSSGVEAIQICLEKEMALILLDLMMPDIDGLGVLDDIRKQGPNIETPVVIISGASQENDSISMECIEKGAIDFIPKPINYDLLIAKTKQLLKLYNQKKELNKLIEKLEYYNFKIRDNQVLLKKITSSANDTIIVINESGNIKFWNEAAQKLFGYHKYEIIDTAFKALLADNTNNNIFIKHIQGHLAKSRNTQNIDGTKQINALKRNGLQVPVEVSFASFHNQQSINLVLIIRDITERIKIQNNLIKNQELREANKIMREFMDNVSHEIRTPMNAIIGISKMMLKYNSNNLTLKQKEGLEMITGSGNRLLDLINDILDLSRLDAKKTKPLLEPFLFDKLLSSIKSTVIGLINEKDLKFIIRKSSFIPDYVISDYRKLLQILINLLGNSVKFTDSGKIELSCHLTDGFLHFEVSDTGIGMTEEESKIIFDRFRRIESAATKKYKGTGLGLAITKELIFILNGSIKVSSKPNIGSTISFSVPVEFPENTASPPAELVSINNGVSLDKKNNKKSVVIIEDDTNLGYLLKSFLSNLKFNIYVYADGQEGYNALNNIIPDLLILDLDIPGLTGYDIMKRLDRKMPGKIPVLIITGSDFTPYKKKYSYSGLLIKPINEEMFVSEILKLTNTK